ncbi:MULTISPECIES: hypothetical protein [Mesonia]|uniref:Uncharacterized protein n=1 Tax=Mesonia oceanica TaxID=2687242 RepID=A0AC61Y732_9FLAO|nr:MULTISPECIES: hypothetical protein [Mesonia]MAN28877.1 hypothetical protein [Mesonia sp.]MAQ40376.1 hypothetical protein [Mesonia sp.]MBJ97997.1 hypothetical protein [Flavobacteriaceae bacterium]VVV00213.1 hypothetical protein FVB9532_01478 [Mesonia oceanica]|tara:strand:+ start:51575 stop:52186 length:612 start_codon:yes stop_codon:yes gene_type:complete
MKRILPISLCLILTLLTSCASKYKLINPEKINYVSKNENKDVSLEYKYDLLHKKYAKKEENKDIKVVAVKITNNSDRDLTLGRDMKLAFDNGNDIHILESEKVFDELKQKPAFYLFYLLLTPLNLYTTNSRGETEDSVPIGLIVGPGLAAGNLLGASGANKNFKEELMHYDIYGMEIPKGQTKYGLIGIKSDSYETLVLKVEE